MKIYLIMVLFSLITYSENIFSEAKFTTTNLGQFFRERNKNISQSSIKNVEEGDVLAFSEVNDHENKTKQSMAFYIAGLHPKNCSHALKKLSHYENYKNLIEFVKLSTYNEEKKEVFFYIDSKLLPTAMTLSFKIPRITEPGVYDFKFDSGIFNGLNGKIIAYEYKNKCLLYTDAYWIGKHTSFPNLVVEVFAQTLSRLGMEKMIRVTKL